MRYNKILKCDCVNCDNGWAVTIFVSGCPHYCKGCYNPETWNYDGGYPFTKEIFDKIVDEIMQPHISALSLSGGEPLSSCNRKDLYELVDEIKKLRPDIKIYCWTGYSFEDLIKDEDVYLQYLLANIDILVDGPFIQEERDVSLPYRGSHNQRVLDCKTSWTTKAPVWVEKYK